MTINVEIAFHYKQFLVFWVNQNFEAGTIFKRVSVEPSHTDLGKPIEFLNEEIKPIDSKKVRFGHRAR